METILTSVFNATENSDNSDTIEFWEHFRTEYENKLNEQFENQKQKHKVKECVITLNYLTKIDIFKLKTKLKRDHIASEKTNMSQLELNQLICEENYQHDLLESVEKKIKKLQKKRRQIKNKVKQLGNQINQCEREIEEYNDFLFQPSNESHI